MHWRVIARAAVLVFAEHGAATVFCAVARVLMLLEAGMRFRRMKRAAALGVGMRPPRLLLPRLVVLWSNVDNPHNIIDVR